MTEVQLQVENEICIEWICSLLRSSVVYTTGYSYRRFSMWVQLQSTWDVMAILNSESMPTIWYRQLWPLQRRRKLVC